MKQETKDEVERLISYYNQHSIDKFVNGDNERLRNFVVEDFERLLEVLEQEV